MSSKAASGGQQPFYYQSWYLLSFLYFQMLNVPKPGDGLAPQLSFLYFWDIHWRSVHTVTVGVVHYVCDVSFRSAGLH